MGQGGREEKWLERFHWDGDAEPQQDRRVGTGEARLSRTRRARGRVRKEFRPERENKMTFAGSRRGLLLEVMGGFDAQTPARGTRTRGDLCRAQNKNRKIRTGGVAVILAGPIAWRTTVLHSSRSRGRFGGGARSMRPAYVRPSQTRGGAGSLAPRALCANSRRGSMVLWLDLVL